MPACIVGQDQPGVVAAWKAAKAQERLRQKMTALEQQAVLQHLLASGRKGKKAQRDGFALTPQAAPKAPKGHGQT